MWGRLALPLHDLTSPKARIHFFQLQAILTMAGLGSKFLYKLGCRGKANNRNSKMRIPMRIMLIAVVVAVCHLTFEFLAWSLHSGSIGGGRGWPSGIWQLLSFPVFYVIP